jgi:hypothetical protein
LNLNESAEKSLVTFSPKTAAELLAVYWEVSSDLAGIEILHFRTVIKEYSLLYSTLNQINPDHFFKFYFSVIQFINIIPASAL